VETEVELSENARLWLIHKGGETRIVIILSFAETDTENALTTKDTTVTVGTEKGRKQRAENMMIETIAGSTHYNELVQTLQNLNQHCSLGKPLVRDLSATINVY